MGNVIAMLGNFRLSRIRQPMEWKDYIREMYFRLSRIRQPMEWKD